MATPPDVPSPLVSLVLPIRNENAHIERAFEAIDRQTYPRDRLEILVVDGGSDDGTLEVVRNRMASDARVMLFGGSGVNTPLAMQLGVEAATGEVIVKVDGHGWMNERFVEVAVARLVSDASLGCVGGVIEPIATTPLQRANSIARFSRLGVGGGVYTLKERVQETDTVQCGAYRSEALEGSGGFDPAMAFGEDEELNFRLRQAGWRILFDPAMRFSYHVRPDLTSLFRQYFRYGRARVAVVRKHPSFLRPKHAAPATLVATLVVTAIVAPLRGWQIVPLVTWGGYLASLAVGALVLAIRSRFTRVDLIAGSLLALHLGYGLGSLRGLLDGDVKSAHRGLQRSDRAPGVGMEHDGVPNDAHPEKQ